MPGVTTHVTVCDDHLRLDFLGHMLMQDLYGAFELILNHVQHSV